MARILDLTPTMLMELARNRAWGKSSRASCTLGDTTSKIGSGTFPNWHMHVNLAIISCVENMGLAMEKFECDVNRDERSLLPVRSPLSKYPNVRFVLRYVFL